MQIVTSHVRLVERGREARRVVVALGVLGAIAGGGSAGAQEPPAPAVVDTTPSPPVPDAAPAPDAAPVPDATPAPDNLGASDGTPGPGAASAADAPVTLSPEAAAAGGELAPDPAPTEGTSEAAAEADSVASAADGGRGSWWAVATEAWRLRATQDPSADTSEVQLFLDGGATALRDRLGVEASLGLWWTVDGRPEAGAVTGTVEADQGFGWASIHSSTDSPVWIDVYNLAVEWRPGGVLHRARVGRMVADRGLLATFDGGQVELRPTSARRLTLFGFGGRTVHFYEIEPAFGEDWIASGGAEYWVRRDLRLVVDYRFAHEDVMTSAVLADDDAPRAGVTAHLYGLEAFWRHAGVQARAYVRGFDASLGWAGAAASWQHGDGTLGVDGRLDVQATELDEIIEDLDPYHLILGTSLEHGRARLDVWKAVAVGPTTLFAHAGGDGRFLLGGSEQEFNRNYGRGYVLLAGEELGVRGLSASASVEYHLTGLESEGLLTFGGGVGYRRGPLRLEGGTSYQRWKYVYFAAPEEIDSVRGFYADARWKAFGWLTIKGHYGYEVFDRRLHTVIVSITETY